MCLNSIECNFIEKKSSDGYKSEVDLKYPDELHESHSDYPLAPEKLKIGDNTWSNFCSNIANEYDIKNGGVNKLVPSLGNESKYIVHYKNPQLHLSLGIKI